MSDPELSVDFTSGAINWRRKHGGGKNQLIAKAVGVKQKYYPSVLDLTGGLGKDAFVLATLGCKVTLLERNPRVYSALSEGIANAKEYARRDDPQLGVILDRLTLNLMDAFVYLRENVDIKQQVIYLDPMFPERKKSAAVKKDMVMLQAIVGSDDDSDQLLIEALKSGASRIVVKRPKLAPSLAQLVPAIVYRGSSSRFDVYPVKKLPG